MTSQPDPVTAVLGKMRQRAVLAADVRLDTGLRVGAAVNLACDDVPRLLAAVGAGLAFHRPSGFVLLGALCPVHENHRHFSITSTEAESVRTCPDCAATVRVRCSCGGAGTTGCLERKAISAALLGEDAGNDRAST